MAVEYGVAFADDKQMEVNPETGYEYQVMDISSPPKKTNHIHENDLNRHV